MFFPRKVKKFKKSKLRLSSIPTSNRSYTVMNKLCLKTRFLKKLHKKASKKRETKVSARLNPMHFYLGTHSLRKTSTKLLLCQKTRSAAVRSALRTKAILGWQRTESRASGLNLQPPSRMASMRSRGRLFGTRFLHRMPGSGKRKSPSSSTGPSGRRTGRCSCS